jgi:L-amino acid N-acyltransferase YncA
MTAEALRAPLEVSLSDGRAVTLRPIRPEDAAGLQAFHARLSPHSIYLRWLAAHPVLTDAEAAQLADVDYTTRMAFVATTGEQIVGVARYGRVSTEHPQEVEAAVVVEDAYQGRGLGTALLVRLLEYSLAQGVTTWVAEINAENARMMRFINRAGLPVTRRFEGGAWQVRMDISAANLS